LPIRETLHLVFVLMPARVAFIFVLSFCTLVQSSLTPAVSPYYHGDPVKHCAWPSIEFVLSFSTSFSHFGAQARLLA